jgi:hypothetical protein
MVIYLIGALYFFLLTTATTAGSPFLAEGPAETADNPSVYVSEELKWDNDRKSYSLCWYEGRNHWLAVDFDASEISAMPVITKIRFYTRDDWPNEGYDGFYVAIFSWVDEGPGTIIWPEDGDEYFFEPAGLPHGDVWADLQVNWMCPDYRFVVAVNQYYDEPDCDPLALDDNPKPSGHSWMYVNNAWSKFDPSSLNIDYANLKIRAVVQDSGVEHSMTPASIGRIKTLYR